ncbi:YeeE/YedE family protein [Flagellimonas algicola]|uniref:YeeE/YedE family protein n=1 Tax=Flagellimonas algicola TaxID=2583815 RepID=A0ABY2WJJ8_9FLAO|nr:YeeE/YedE thiosulfate transporter family protein [Allomuricauda algicola]TMU54770.1 YeeE/YedE family protein [Allomuricauda algicola]
MELIMQPWPWYVSGPLIVLVMALLILMGKRFGMSTNLETMCSISGAGRFVDYFKTDVKSKIWSLMVVLGVVFGGFLGANLLSENRGVAISESSVTTLNELGFSSAGKAYLPSELFSLESLSNPFTWVILLVAGFLVGFGARYAGGCTSGHAISGLSNLQLPSLVAVLGFFVGGLVMIHLLFPLIF